MAAKLENKVNSSESYTNPKPKTAVNGRSEYEHILGTETLTSNYHFSFGAPSSAIMAKLRPLLTEATKQCMVRFLKTFTVLSGAASSISEGAIFIYSCSGQLSSFEIDLILLCSHHCTGLKVV